jgi:alpha-amylase
MGEQDWNATTGTWNDPIPPFVKHDNVPGFDPAFGGRERSNQNSNPSDVVITDSLDYGDWFRRTTGMDGFRFDDVKGTWPNFVAQFMRYRSLAAVPFYSEFFDNAFNAGNWATSWPMEGRSAIEDFDAHFAIQSACNNGDAWSLKDGGYFLYRPDLACVFVENPDTDTSPGEQIIWSKLLGYAYALTVPCRNVIVYGKDYFPASVWPGSYGLKPWIDQMAWASRVLAFGAYSVLYCDGTAIVMQRNGQGGSVGTSPGLVTAISFDQHNARTITVPTCFWPGTHLHDFLGHHGDIWCDGAGNATFTIPPNTNGAGQNALMFSWAGMEGHVITVNTGTAIQDIEAADDLDVAPIPAGTTAPCGLPIYADAGTAITITVKRGDITLITVTGPDGNFLTGGGNSFAVQVAGWHQISATNTGAVNAPYLMSVQYTAPKGVVA